MCYEVREFTVFLFHETDSQYEIRKRYDEEMDREVREVLPTARRKSLKQLTRLETSNVSESEKKSMLEMGRLRDRKRKSKPSRGTTSHRRHSRRRAGAGEV